MRKNPHFDFSHLTAEERVQLAQDLWESLEPEERDWPLSEAQKAELDRRLEKYERNPGAGQPWEKVRDRLKKKHGLGNASAA